MTSQKKHRIHRIPQTTKKELLAAIRQMQAELRADGRALDVALAKSQALAFLDRQDAGFIGWPPKPKCPSEVLMLACYVNECRLRKERHLVDAAILAQRVRSLSRFLKGGDPMVQLANQNAEPS